MSGASLRKCAIASGGGVVLADQAGQLRVSVDQGAGFAPLKLERPMAAHAVAAVGDTLVVAGARGLQTRRWACQPGKGRS